MKEQEDELGYKWNPAANGMAKAANNKQTAQQSELVFGVGVGAGVLLCSMGKICIKCIAPLIIK